MEAHCDLMQIRGCDSRTHNACFLDRRLLFTPRMCIFLHVDWLSRHTANDGSSIGAVHRTDIPSGVHRFLGFCLIFFSL